MGYGSLRLGVLNGGTRGRRTPRPYIFVHKVTVIEYTGISHGTVGMAAFTTTQTTDSVLLRGVSFRTPGNAPISSQYILYANGRGQTYWSNAVLPSDVSSISSYIGTTYGTLTLEVQALSNAVVASYNDISTLRAVDAQLSNNIGTLSNTMNIFGNQLATQVANIYTSTVTWVNSTLYTISSFSSFYVSTAYILSTTVEGLSSLSTAMSLQNAQTYAALTSNYTALVAQTTASTFVYVDNSVLNLANSTTAAYTKAIDVLSSATTQQMLSTSAGLQSTLSSVNGMNDSQFNQFYNDIYVSSILVDEQKISSLAIQVRDLQTFSTALSTLSFEWVSTFVSTSQGQQDTRLYAALWPLSSVITGVVQSTAAAVTAVNTQSTYTAQTFSTTQSSINALFRITSSLIRQFSTLTTSSILANVYDTFMQLEGYTTGLINSTISTVSTFVSSLYYSTVVQNMSMANAYFTAFTDSAYASTISTLVPSTISYVSSMISTLYDQSYSTLTVSLTSTSTEITNQFVSTTSSLTYWIIASTQTQMESSVRGYLSTPSAQLYSTVSTLNFIALSSFIRSANTSLSTYSTLFFSTNNANQSQFSTLFASTQGTLTFLSTQQGQYASTNTAILSTFSTNFSAQMSTQSTLFASTLATYPGVLNSSLNSTNTAYTAVASTSVAATLNSVQTSSLAMYQQFARDLNAQASTIMLSTLYTNASMDLTGSNFQAMLDLVSYRNFTVNVYNPLNGQLPYTITYASNAINGLDYRSGIITINISTVGSAYTTNNGRLRFDVYRWGIPTTIWGNVYPFMSNASYSLQYQYTILSNTVYTNLLGVYPTLGIRGAAMSSIGGTVAVGTSNNFSQANSFYWRGSPVLISWSNYNFFPQSAVGAPPFNPDILIDVQVSNVTVQQFGPYPFSVSSAIITAPYLRNAAVPVIPTKVRTYIVGKPMEAMETSFTTLLPVFDSLALYPRTYAQTSNLQFIGGGELVAVTDAGTAPLYLAPVTVAGTTAATSYNGSAQFAASNLVNGLSNISAVLAGTKPIRSRNTLAGFLNASTNQFFENTAQTGYRSFILNYSTSYISALSNIVFRYSNATAPQFIVSSLTNPTQYSAFTPNYIAPYSSNAWIVANSTLTTLTPQFTTENGACVITTLFSTTAYTESNFVGPLGSAGADSASYAQITGLGLSSNMVPMSTLTYLNVSADAPIAASNAHGNALIASFTYGGQTYYSTFVLSSLATQVFSL